MPKASGSAKAEEAPGPGAYDAAYLLSNKKRGLSFTRERRLKDDKDLNPGPGHYDQKPHFADVPHYLLPKGPQKSRQYL